MGVAQHHDAVSGTEKQHVAYDYARRLSEGTEQVFNALEPLIKSRLRLDLNENIYLCPKLNISECLPIEDKSVFSVFFWNPLARPVDSWQRIPVRAASLACPIEQFGVYNLEDRLLVSEIVKIDETIKRIPERSSKADYEIVFLANLAPLNFTGFVFTCHKTIKKDLEIEIVKEKRGNLYLFLKKLKKNPLNLVFFFI